MKYFLSTASLLFALFFTNSIFANTKEIVSPFVVNGFTNITSINHTFLFNMNFLTTSGIGQFIFSAPPGGKAAPSYVKMIPDSKLNINVSDNGHVLCKLEFTAVGQKVSASVTNISTSDTNCTLVGDPNQMFTLTIADKL